MRFPGMAVAVAVAVAGAALSGAPAAAQQTTPVCHYTGDPQQPYVLIQASPQETDVHVDHDLDVVPAPSLGCPTLRPAPDPEPTVETPDPLPTAEESTTICHFGADGLFETLTLTPDGLQPHALHERDIVPAPAAGCAALAVSEEEGVIIEEEIPSERSDAAAGTDEHRGAVAGTGADGPSSRRVAARSLQGIPMTGARPDAIVLFGLAFLLVGAGLRLLYPPSRAR